MLPFITAIAESLKSSVLTQALKAIMPIAEPAVQNALTAAVSDVHVPTVISNIANEIAPHVAVSWTQDELNAAANSFMALHATAGMSMHDVFEAGAEWTRSLVSASVKSMASDAVHAVAPSAPAVVAEVVGDVAQVAVDVAQGNMAAAVAEVVQDVSPLVYTQ